MQRCSIENPPLLKESEEGLLLVIKPGRRVRLQNPTSISMGGTSIKTPTTVANATPEERPNNITAEAMATSKELEAPNIAAGPAYLY